MHNFVRSVAAWETLPDDGLRRYERYAPELWDSVRPLYDAGRYAEAADKGRELIKARPDQASYLYYNVACCESLARRTADAIEHLRQAIDKWGGLPRHGEGGLRPRSNPRRARVRGTDRPLARIRFRRPPLSSANDVAAVSRG